MENITDMFTVGKRGKGSKTETGKEASYGPVSLTCIILCYKVMEHIIYSIIISNLKLTKYYQAINTDFDLKSGRRNGMWK